MCQLLWDEPYQEDDKKAEWRLCSHFLLESRIFSSCPDLQEKKRRSCWNSVDSFLARVNVKV